MMQSCTLMGAQIFVPTKWPRWGIDPTVSIVYVVLLQLFIGVEGGGGGKRRRRRRKGSKEKGDK